MEKLSAFFGLANKDAQRPGRARRSSSSVTATLDKRGAVADDKERASNTDRNARVTARPSQRNGQQVYIRRRSNPVTPSSPPVSPSQRPERNNSDEHRRSSQQQGSGMESSRSKKTELREGETHRRRHSRRESENTREQMSSGRPRRRDESDRKSPPSRTEKRQGHKTSQRRSQRSTDDHGVVPTAACAICLDDHPRTNLFALPCAHNWCRACTKQAFKHALSSPTINDSSAGGGSSITPKCCKHHIHLDDVRTTFHGLFHSAFKRSWRRRYAESQEANPVYCPNRVCSAWMPRELFGEDRKGKRSVMVRCAECECKVCRNCHAKYHGDKPCKEDSGMRKALRYIRKDANSQLCPGCGQGVQKSAGCNHMKCVCGCDFCIKCGSEYESGACPKQCSLINFAPDPQGDARLAQQLQDEFHNFWDFEVFEDGPEIRPGQRAPIPLPFRPRAARHNPAPPAAPRNTLAFNMQNSLLNDAHPFLAGLLPVMLGLHDPGPQRPRNISRDGGNMAFGQTRSSAARVRAGRS